MLTFICDEMYDNVLESLSNKIKDFYTVEGKTKYPILIGAGKSGNEVSEKIVKKLSTKDNQLTFYPVDVEKKGEFLANSFGGIDFKGKFILICDSIVNSGTTLYNMKNYFYSREAEDVKTLTVFLRNGADFIPNFWASYIGEFENIVFGTTRIPISFYKVGNIRKLTKKDCGNTVDCGKDFIPNIIDDYYYRQCIDPTYCAYIIEEKNNFAGIAYIKRLKNNRILLDVLAIKENMQSQGYGTALLRFLEEFCRINEINEIILYAHESVKD